MGQQKKGMQGARQGVSVSLLLLFLLAVLKCKSLTVQRRRYCPTRYEVLKAQPSGQDHVQTTDSDPNERERQLQRRLDKLHRTRSMPLSQRWYKDKQSHLSKNQKNVIRELWPVYGLDLQYGRSLDIPGLFNASSGKVVLDIGFGSGESLVHSAQDGSTLVLGVEIHKPGIAHALQALDAHNFSNVRVVRADISLLINALTQCSILDEIHIFFPDPWVNLERDEGRRMIRSSLINEYARLLKNGGLLRVSTDVDEYAGYTQQMLLHPAHAWIMTQNQSYLYDPMNNMNNTSGVTAEVNYRPVTKYEKKARESGRRVWDMVFQLKK